MSKRWIRQEVKKNEVADVLGKVWAWQRSNHQQVLGGAGVLLVLLLLGGYFAYQRLMSARAAWHQLSLAQSYIYQGQAGPALSELQALIQQFDRTPAWGFAVLLEGDILFHQGDFQQAAATYQKILERQSP